MSFNFSVPTNYHIIPKEMFDSTSRLSEIDIKLCTVDGKVKKIRASVFDPSQPTAWWKRIIYWLKGCFFAKVSVRVRVKGFSHPLFVRVEDISRIYNTSPHLFKSQFIKDDATSFLLKNHAYFSKEKEVGDFVAQVRQLSDSLNSSEIKLIRFVANKLVLKDIKISEIIDLSHDKKKFINTILAIGEALAYPEQTNTLISKRTYPFTIGPNNQLSIHFSHQNYPSLKPYIIKIRKEDLQFSTTELQSLSHKVPLEKLQKVLSLANDADSKSALLKTLDLIARQLPHMNKASDPYYQKKQKDANGKALSHAFAIYPKDFLDSEHIFINMIAVAEGNSKKVSLAIDLLNPQQKWVRFKSRDINFEAEQMRLSLLHGANKNLIDPYTKGAVVHNASTHSYLQQIPLISKFFNSTVSSSLPVVFQPYYHNAFVLVHATIPQIIRVFYDVAYGLDRLHQQGYIHCDIKPENIYVKGDLNQGRVRGLIGDIGTTKETNTKIKGLDRYYSPPESNVPGAPDFVRIIPALPSIDCFSFGLTMLQIIDKKLSYHFLNKDSPNTFTKQDEFNTLLGKYLDKIETDFKDSLINQKALKSLIEICRSLLQINNNARPSFSSTARSLYDLL